MEKQVFISYNGNDYEVKRPTLNMWSKLQLFKEIEDERQFMISLIGIATGMSDDEIKSADWSSIKEATEFLSTYFLEVEQRFYKEFEFKGVKYQFLDLNNLTFGEFIDIDDFLNKDESYRKGNMNMFMALLYRPVENGVIGKYNTQEVQKRAELFKELDLKYLQGALLFFLTLETTLHAHIHYSLRNKVRLMLSIPHKTFLGIGAGMGRWFSSLMRTSPN